MTSMPIQVNRYLCQTEFAGWRRTNRNNRIAKKWRKRYGAVWRCKGKCYQVAGLGMVMCPCVKAALDKATDKTTR